MKPARYKAALNRRRQWALLGALAPDVALLQECRPDDLASLAPSWMVDDYDIISSVPARMSGSAILARKNYRPAPPDLTLLPDRERRWLSFFARYVATAQLTVEGLAVTVASVHALAGKVSNVAITDDDHDMIRRSSRSRASYSDVAAYALMPLTRDNRFIVGGDWNISLLFDTTAPRTAPGAAEFFTARSTAEWHHALRKFSPNEIRTYLEPGSAAYELDHIFTDLNLHEALTGCSVFSEPTLRALSDHAPVVAEFDAFQNPPQ